MKDRIFGLVRRIQTIPQSWKKTVYFSIPAVEMPAKLKNTIMERWLLYYKNLYHDYKDVAIEVGKNMRKKPIRSTVIGSVGLGLYICALNNPNETSFIDKLKCYGNDVSLVSDVCRNPETAHHLRYVERCYNEGIVRRLSLGVLSFMWLDNYDKALGIYKAVCPYLQCEYLKFDKRIIDIGFWNVWWTLEKKMIDYDVNV